MILCPLKWYQRSAGRVTSHKDITMGRSSVWQQNDSFKWLASVHFASDRCLAGHAGDLLHGRLAGYGVAYAKDMYSE